MFYVELGGVMKCKCGGKLIRIAVDCYQCNLCELKQKVAFASLPTKPMDIPLDINIQQDINTNINNNIIKQLGKDIAEALGVPERYFNKK
jgi:hypothetical protein